TGEHTHGPIHTGLLLFHTLYTPIKSRKVSVGEEPRGQQSPRIQTKGDPLTKGNDDHIRPPHRRVGGRVLLRARFRRRLPARYCPPSRERHRDPAAHERKYRVELPDVRAVRREVVLPVLGAQGQARRRPVAVVVLEERVVEVEQRVLAPAEGAPVRPQRPGPRGVVRRQPVLGRVAPPHPSQRHGREGESHDNVKGISLAPELGVARAVRVLRHGAVGEVHGVKRHGRRGQERPVDAAELHGRHAHDADEGHGDDRVVAPAAAEPRVQHPDPGERQRVERKADGDRRLQPPLALPERLPVRTVSLGDPRVVPIVGQVNDYHRLHDHEHHRTDPAQVQKHAREPRLVRDEHGRQDQQQIYRELGGPDLAVQQRPVVRRGRRDREEEEREERRPVDRRVPRARLERRPRDALAPGGPVPLAPVRPGAVDVPPRAGRLSDRPPPAAPVVPCYCRRQRVLEDERE
ncbi:hypothetical protein THAOC_23042, partial [Thalassiosira oceanica]